MSLPTGDYHIFSIVHKDGVPLRFAVYNDGLFVNDSSNSKYHVKNIGGDRYQIEYVPLKQYIGTSDDITTDDNLQLRNVVGEWAIDPAGADQYKVHIPNQNLYWQIPSTVEDRAHIKLARDEGKDGEIWVFKA